MNEDHRFAPENHPGAVRDIGLDEIVMGLHWDPPQEADKSDPANLDALCVLLGGDGRVLDIIDPGRPRNENGSVIHTGDSKTGASEWDDERIFVFLRAVPADVAVIRFIVVSVTGRPLHEIRGACCHVSDRITEREWVRQELSGLRGKTAHCVATVCRGPEGWAICSEPEGVHGGIPAGLASFTGTGAHDESVK